MSSAAPLRRRPRRLIRWGFDCPGQKSIRRGRTTGEKCSTADENERKISIFARCRVILRALRRPRHSTFEVFQDRSERASPLPASARQRRPRRPRRKSPPRRVVFSAGRTVDGPAVRAIAAVGKQSPRSGAKSVSGGQVGAAHARRCRKSQRIEYLEWEFTFKLLFLQR